MIRSALAAAKLRYSSWDWARVSPVVTQLPTSSAATAYSPGTYITLARRSADWFVNVIDCSSTCEANKMSWLTKASTVETDMFESVTSRWDLSKVVNDMKTHEVTKLAEIDTILHDCTVKRDAAVKLLSVTLTTTPTPGLP